MKNTGTRLREVQRVFGETQKTMAGKLKIHFNTLQKYQAGDRTPDAKILERVCEVYGVSPEWLLMGRGEILGAGPSVGGGISVAESAILLRRVAKLVKERRKRLLQIAVVMEDVEERDRRNDLLLGQFGKEGLMASQLEKLAGYLRRMDELEWEIVTKFVGPQVAEEEQGSDGGTGEQPKTGQGKKKTKQLLPALAQEKLAAATEAEVTKKLQASKEYQEALDAYEALWKEILLEMGA